MRAYSPGEIRKAFLKISIKIAAASKSSYAMEQLSKKHTHLLIDLQTELSDLYEMITSYIRATDKEDERPL